MFAQLGKALDRELDEFVPMLVKRSGEVSQAGRENFLTAEADRTLSSMCANVTEAKAVAALLAHAAHKSPTCRTSVASHINAIVENALNTGSLAGNPQVREARVCASGYDI